MIGIISDSLMISSDDDCRIRKVISLNLLNEIRNNHIFENRNNHIHTH